MIQWLFTPIFSIILPLLPERFVSLEIPITPLFRIPFATLTPCPPEAAEPGNREDRPLPAAIGFAGLDL
jgi:hypothetical protein